MTSIRLKAIALSLGAAGLWALPVTGVSAQQAQPAAQASAVQPIAPITAETTAAEITQRFPAGGASFANALRGFLDANANQLGVALNHIKGLMPNLNSAQSETVGEVLGRLAADLMARKDLDNLRLVQELVARGNSFLIAGYNRSTGLNPDTAGLGGGTGGGAGPVGSIAGAGGGGGGGAAQGNSAFGTSSSNPITGGGGASASVTRYNSYYSYTNSISPF
ncbi:hypothetical protein BLTE_00960 [Blastochloris tepida]|uniref:Uncharacterized protein n=2 Tax=Blastochloris tepida TaxID=2233851 RepID=A0A348FVS8_9HYPH|nr:hypothetical protein BLTE_00960 [Blastochloris tepida]